MTEQEQIEVWTEQFENWAYDYPGSPLDKKYLLQTWLAAKRAMPVIELPKPEVCFANPPFAFVILDGLIDAITAAGYQYKIKGE